MEFKRQLVEMRAYLADRKMLKEVGKRAGVEVRTVHDAFSSQTFDDLKGARLKVYKEAIKMIEEIKSLPAMASEALSK